MFFGGGADNGVVGELVKFLQDGGGDPSLPKGKK